MYTEWKNIFVSERTLKYMYTIKIKELFIINPYLNEHMKNQGVFENAVISVEHKNQINRHWMNY